jgi:hypothetical protein
MRMIRPAPIFSLIVRWASAGSSDRKSCSLSSFQKTSEQQFCLPTVLAGRLQAKPWPSIENTEHKRTVTTPEDIFKQRIPSLGLLIGRN